VAQRSGAAIDGRLAETASGRPIVGARILLQTIGSEPTRPPPTRTVVGTVPANARFAMLGMRVNTECYCSGANDLMVGDLTYSDSGGVRERTGVPAPPERPQVTAAPGLAAPGPLIRITEIGSQQVARVVVKPDQHFGFNSPMFAVTPGAQFSFSAPLGALGDGGLFGTVVVIWFDADRHGLSRAYLRLPRDLSDVASAITGADGRFAFPASVVRAPGRGLRLEFDGGAADRGAVAYPR
jgi:hypothetical protein